MPDKVIEIPTRNDLATIIDTENPMQKAKFAEGTNSIKAASILTSQAPKT